MTGPRDPVPDLDELISSVWVLTALAAASRTDPLPDELGAVLGAGGYAERTADGWVLTPPYQGIGGVHTFSRQVSQILRQAADVAEAGTEREKDEDGRLADGRLSGIRMATFLDVLEARLPDVRERLQGPDVRFLDVGVGVGGITSVVLERLPSASAVGIDVDNRMIAQADGQLKRHGLSDRVRLRHQDVRTLADRCHYDLAWLPLVALSPDDAAAALPRILTALRPGGWLLTATALRDPSDNRAGTDGAGTQEGGTTLTDAIVRWRTTRRGVTCWAAAELAERLGSVGYVHIHVIDLEDRGMPLVVARAPA